MSIRILHPREFLSLAPDARQLVMAYLTVQPDSDVVLERALEEAVFLAHTEGVPLGAELFKTLFSCAATPTPNNARWGEEWHNPFFSVSRWMS